MPAAVRDLCDQARYTRASVAGTASIAFILKFESEVVDVELLQYSQADKRSCLGPGQQESCSAFIVIDKHATSNRGFPGINKENINSLIFVLRTRNDNGNVVLPHFPRWSLLSHKIAKVSSPCDYAHFWSSQQAALVFNVSH
jgi:hypothetical protein